MNKSYDFPFISRFASILPGKEVMEHFVKTGSIVRTIWGKSDTVLFIFAGSAAEFALNKAVDWLYYTGQLPADPIGRLFSTVSYARNIIFAPREEALQTIGRINSIHGAIEKARGHAIPDWSYRDVLFMLIHYSIASFELLERPLTDEEKEEVYDVFYRTGLHMELKNLPQGYTAWTAAREEHLNRDLFRSGYTTDLFLQYRRHLGLMRYQVLLAAQNLVAPPRVRELLGFRPFSWLRPAVPVYKWSRRSGLDAWIRAILLPQAYKKQIEELDVVN